MYDSVYGKEYAIQPNMEEPLRRALTETNAKRQEDLKKIFLNGLESKVKQELWPRLNPTSCFEDMVKAAVIADTILLKKETKKKTNEGIIAPIENSDYINRDRLEKAEKEVDDLKAQISLLIGKIGEIGINKRDRTRSRERVTFQNRSKSPHYQNNSERRKNSNYYERSP